MKSYKEYEKSWIGGSDGAALLMYGPVADGDGCKALELKFTEDGDYRAYIVDGEAEIGTHYKKVAEFRGWVRIYDDESLSYKADADRINIYRAGDLSCIIQLLKD